MTNPNNGATLEDCHSNFFALTDLCGIRWRRFVSEGPAAGSAHGHHSYGPLDDPVLSSFARCLAADVLCVWRRSPNARNQQQQQQSQSTTPNDPFMPVTPTGVPPQFMQAGGPGSMQNPSNVQMHMQQQQQQQSHQLPSHLMSPNGGMGLPPGHVNHHGLNVPPPYPSGQSNPSSSSSHLPHGHGMPQQPSTHNQQQQQQQPFSNPSLNGPKELWIFWYGEEPDLSSLVSQQLLKADPDQGTWENGLSYECRTLLFKALHNLIERCLLSREFVRVDKWFIQPCDDNQRIGLKTFPMQLSFSFEFFVHGESTVCMSVDVRQHPAIRRIGKTHISVSQTQVIPVILAPYGLAGTLTGVGYRMSDPGTHKILEEWKQFYPVESALKSPLYDTALPTPTHASPHPSNTAVNSATNPVQAPPNGSTGIPPVVEVRVGGVIMRYPSCYVLCTELDELHRDDGISSNCSSNNNRLSVAIPSAPRSRSTTCADSESAAYPSGPSPNKPQGAAYAKEIDKIEGVLPERVWQECMLSVQKANHETGLSSATYGALGNSGINAECLGQWDFADPMKKSTCTCSKCGSKSSKSSSSSGGNSSSTGGSQSTKSGSTKARKSSYHKRNLQQLAALQKWDNLWDLPEDSSENSTTVDQAGSISKPGDSFMANSSSANLRSMGMPGTPLGGPPSYKGPGSIVPVGLGSDGIVGASPMSVIPSPLPTPKSQQPSSVHPHEGLLLSSPQPASDKPSATPMDAGAPKSVSSLSNQVFSPVVGTFDGAKGDSVEPSASAGHHVESQPRGPPGSANSANINPSEGANVGTYSKYVSKGLRRPILPSKEYEKQLEEEEKTQPSDIIYDYSQLEIWLNYPVKRMKSNDGRSKGTNYSWGFGMKTLPEYVNGPYERNYHGKRAADPYDFDDEHHQGSDGSKRREAGSKDDGQSDSGNGAKKAPPSSLFTSEGIKASMMDLDQIFDNSDTSSDETFQAPTPPGSNKPAGSMEDIISSSIRHKNQFSSLRPEELSKMFPTPPSHEHNPILSPMGLQPETPSALETLIETSKRGQDNYSLTGSPVEELGELKSDSSNSYSRSSGIPSHNRNQSQDWSYVYKPPSIYKMLGSSKYAPLHSLPSQQLPPITLPVSSTYTPSYMVSSSSAASTQTTSVTVTRSTSTVPIASNAMIHQSRAAHMRPGLSPRSPAAAGFRGPMSDLGSPTPNMYLTMRGSHPGSIPNQSSHGSQALSQTGHSIRGSEAHALVVNLSLSDSVVNLFRDHNFDSCTMCVCTCNFGKAVGNIRGSEMGLYIPDSSVHEDPIRCNCGFSASVNRRLAHGAGLFYEDEYEITTPALAQEALPPDEWYDRKKPSFLLLDPKYPNVSALMTDKDACMAASVVDHMPAFLLESVREQCLFNIGNVTSRFSGDIVDPKSIEKAYNLLYFLDGNRAALTALEHGRTVMIEAKGMSRSAEDALPLKPKQNIMHQWPFLWGQGPKSSQDVMQVMRMLLPLLQEAVQLPSGANTVNGPLTWRQFNLLAIKGTDVRCEPQPIPSILVGSEKDFVALSPLAVRFWEKLSLEPYGHQRDVAYIVVSPDSDFVLSKVRTFFKELSTVYEACQLGRHSPIAKVLRDGILRVGKSAASKLSTEQVDEWFTKLPNVPAAAVLKLYAQVCRHYLAPQLASINLDHTLLEPSQSNRSPGQERPTPSPKMPPPSDPTMGPSPGPPTPKSEYDTTDVPVKEIPAQESLEDDEREPPALVVYLIDPFGFAVDNKDVHRMANLGLLRCFASMLTLLPETVRNNITLQVVSLEDVLSLGNSLFDAKFKSDQFRHLALTVYSQCRRLLVHQNTVKSLTGFGPAAAADLFLRMKDERRSPLYRLYTPPFVLVPSKEKTSEGAEWMNSMPGYTIAGMVSSGNNQVGGPKLNPAFSSVLYVAYCISEDHRWLLASATDERGELLETTMISIYVPNRSKRRKASARKHGLNKLMDFILGLMSMGVNPWRLVVGRLGRVGHGELESWSSLLSKKNLIRASTQLREACRQCELQCQYDCPCVLSASLVSFEPDSCLRLMPDQFTPDERFSEGNSNLSTPQDISVTHVMAFPTSATTQSSQSTFHEQHLNPNIDDDDLLLTLGGDGDDMGVDDQITGGLDFTDIFNNWEDNTTGGQSPLGGSPRKDSASQPGSPGIGASGRQSPNFQQGSQGRMGGRGEPGEDFGTILQQPLALGYYVSTAPAGNLPKWFWASCPQRSVEQGGAVFLKSALHLHSHSILQNSDDILQQQSQARQHALDSQLTADVLRFVLEGYNALSWLTFDPKTHDRQSCLPVHMQKLIQLYHTTGTLV